MARKALRDRAASLIELSEPYQGHVRHYHLTMVPYVIGCQLSGPDWISTIPANERSARRGPRPGPSSPRRDARAEAPGKELAGPESTTMQEAGETSRRHPDSTTMQEAASGARGGTIGSGRRDSSSRHRNARYGALCASGGKPASNGESGGRADLVARGLRDAMGVRSGP
jgi:hypothetical protein